MKQVQQLLSAFLILTLFTFNQCKKNKNEEAQLPPETQTGAMTFGCKIDGKVFVPRDGRGKVGLYCEYAYLGTGVGGGWFLNIPAADFVPVSIPNVSITTDSLLVVEGVTYRFKNLKGNPKAFYSDDTGLYRKMDNDSGSLHISKFDQTNRILSGTFSFVGTNASSGVKVTITDGRFDVRY